jgi:ketosteroid isomerase-like protein
MVALTCSATTSMIVLLLTTAARDTGRAMSQENVEIVRRGWEHFVTTGEPLWATIDDEIVIHDHDIPDSGDYRGYAGFAQWGEDWEAAWEDWRWEAEEFIGAGDRVVAVLRVNAKGRGSGVDVERLDGAVWTVRDGKCIRLDYYGSKAEALEAVGLRE